MVDLYLNNGYLNAEALASRPAWLHVIIGARQIGKTYGVLRYHLENNIPHLLLRRTSEEVKLIGGSQQLNPYQVFAPDFNTAIFRTGRFYTINDHDKGEKRVPDRGLCMSLAMIKNIRGFNGRWIKSIVFDEFIPEKGAYKLASDGDSLLNAYTTINGNRELDGQPPCSLWLLANSNDINSPILDALNLTDTILEMRRKHKEYYEADGVQIVQPKSLGVLEQRKETALIRQINNNSEFYGMAINNDFSYDASPLVRTIPLKGFKPLCSYENLFFWENPDMIYCCRAVHPKENYSGNYGAGQFTARYLWLKRYYAENLISFSDMKLLAKFKLLMNLDF